MTKKEQLSNAANLHWAAFQMTGSDYHYKMALQYQKWTQEAGA